MLNLKTKKTIIDIFDIEEFKFPFAASIRFAVLLCLAVRLFGTSTTSLATGGGFNQLLRWTFASFFYFSEYLTIPLIVLGILLRVSMNKSMRVGIKQITSLWLLWLFLLYIILQIFFSSRTDIAYYRWGMFLTRSVPIMLCAFFFPDRKGILLIRNMILSVAIIKITALFLFPQGIFAILRGEHLGLTEEGNARLSLESDPITTASHLCIQALIGMMVLLNGKTRSKVKKLLLIALIVTLLLFTFMTGSRGPVIGFATIFVLLILINLKKFGSTTTVTLLIILIAIFAFISASKINPFSTERFTEESISTDTRKDMYLSIISSKPTLFGEGVGSFGITTLEGPESAKYPHNMTLELYYETGMFGLILFLLLFGSCIFLLYRNYRLHQDEAPVFCLSCLVFFWIGGQFSGYLLANKGFFIFLVLSTWLTKIDYSEIKTKYTY